MERGELLTHVGLDVFVAFDFETTGFDAARDGIIEFSAVRFRGGLVEDSFSTLVNPGFSIPPHIVSLTGITDAMVREAPPEEEIAGKALSFLGKDPLVAHNIDFDLRFLGRLQSTHLGDTVSIPNVLYDTLVLSQAYLYFHANHRLATVGEYLGHPRTGEHRALADATLCGQILVSLVEEAASYPLSLTQRLASLFASTSVPNGQLFENLVRLMVRMNLSGRGLVPSRIQKPVPSNVFAHHGSSGEVPESAEDVFGNGGRFSRQKGFEVRPGQIQYSEFVSRILEKGGVGITEAETGLGKSVAYLLPALRWGIREEQGPTVVSCYTRHLQDQLFNQELPKLVQALDISFAATVLKGRQNYLCRTRLDWLTEDAGKLLSPYEVQSLAPIIVWLHWTRTGDFEECPGFLNRKASRVKALIQSDPGFCSRQMCAGHKGCFLAPIREASMRADLIVGNHSLLLSELSNPGILPRFSRVIIDEAHNLVKVAYDHFRVVLHRAGIRDRLASADPKSRRSSRLKTQMNKVGAAHPAVARRFSRVQSGVRHVLDASDRFFRHLAVERSGDYDPGRSYSQRKRFRDFESHFKNLVPDLDSLVEFLEDLTHHLTALHRKLKELPEGSVDIASRVTVERLVESATEILEAVQSVALEEKSDWVYWEEGLFSNQELTVSLNGVPVHIGQKLVEVLFSPLDAVVATSATLRVGESFEYIRSRLGLTDFTEKSIHAGAFPSPFHYEDQCRYFQWAGKIPPESPDFPNLLADVIRQIRSAWGKRTLVLFTSREALDGCHRVLQSRGDAGQMPLFVQHAGSSRGSLLQGFKSSPGSVLLGTSSFWEGVDLPRESLEVLVVTKLPFDVPDDPVIQAYNETVDREGGNSFLQHTVPEAAIRLRQGFGRLIRSSHDEGIFINMDNRVMTRQYGHHFQQAIPVKLTPFTSPDQLEGRRDE
ncbi:MAG: helicase C-terminal domain-containing protein [Fidelibacterota bacterium]